MSVSAAIFLAKVGIKIHRARKLRKALKEAKMLKGKKTYIGIAILVATPLLGLLGIEVLPVEGEAIGLAIGAVVAIVGRSLA